MSVTTGAAVAAPFAYVIRPTPPDSAPVRELLDPLDTHLASLHTPEDNHILGIDAPLAALGCSKALA